MQVILKEVSLYRWPPVWLVWISLLSQMKTKIVSCHTADSKPSKQEVNGTVILPPFSIPCTISIVGSISLSRFLTKSWLSPRDVALYPDNWMHQNLAGSATFRQKTFARQTFGQVNYLPWNFLNKETKNLVLKMSGDQKSCRSNVCRPHGFRANEVEPKFVFALGYFQLVPGLYVSLTFCLIKQIWKETGLRFKVLGWQQGIG